MACIFSIFGRCCSKNDMSESVRVSHIFSNEMKCIIIIIVIVIIIIIFIIIIINICYTNLFAVKASTN